MPICPECNVEIDCLNYECSTSGWESGSIGIQGNGIDWNYENGENEDSDNFEFKCPECDEVLFNGSYEAEQWLLAEVTTEKERKKKEKEKAERNFEF